ncbi:MAG: DNA cytosine methyltransferase, partial [Thermoanaerobaculia bacterium]
MSEPANPGGRPVAIDLFAGAGGLALGFEQAGFDIAAAVEFDPIHAATHELNFPETAVICADVRSVSGEEIREAAGLGDRTIDAVVGGPPCQGFSLIGHRVLHDPRNSLVFHFYRLVVELKPRVFMMENVPGMATGRHTELLRELIQRFASAGYRVRLPYRILNAADYGVPQDRRRLFVLGARSDARLPEYPDPTAFWNGRNGRSRGESALPSVK